MKKTTRWKKQQDGKNNKMEKTTRWKKQQDEKNNKMEKTTRWKKQQDGKNNKMEKTTRWKKQQDGKNNKMKKLKAGTLKSLPLDDLEYIHFILCLYILPTICCCYRGIFSQRFFLLFYTYPRRGRSCIQPCMIHHRCNLHILQFYH